MKITAKHIESGAEFEVFLLARTNDSKPSGKSTTIIGHDGIAVSVDARQFFDGCTVFANGEDATDTLRSLVFPMERPADRALNERSA